MIRVLVVGLFVSMIFSCTGKSKPPDDVLPPLKMQELLWDLSRADQYTQDLILHDTLKKPSETNKELYTQVFAIHKVTPAEFEKSYDYYKHHPNELRVMLDSLQARKSREIERSLLENVKPRPVADTLSVK